MLDRLVQSVFRYPVIAVISLTRTSLLHSPTPTYTLLRTSRPSTKQSLPQHGPGGACDDKHWALVCWLCRSTLQTHPSRRTESVLLHLLPRSAEFAGARQLFFHQSLTNGALQLGLVQILAQHGTITGLGVVETLAGSERLLAAPPLGSPVWMGQGQGANLLARRQGERRRETSRCTTKAEQGH